MKYFFIRRVKCPHDTKTCISVTFWFHERRCGYFVQISSLVGSIASPLPPQLVVFSQVSWSISAASEGALGLRVWLDVEPPFVCDQD